MNKFVLLFLGVLFLSGCAYRGGKVVEGTDLAVGIDIPAAEGVAQFNVLNYLSGFRLGVDRNANFTVHYTVAETNDYFGCIHTRTYKTIDSTVEPVETDPSNVDEDPPAE